MHLQSHADVPAAANGGHDRPSLSRKRAPQTPNGRPGGCGQLPTRSHLARLRIRSVEPWRWPACCVFRAPRQRISAHFDVLTSSERPDQHGSSERLPGPYSFRQVVLTRADGDTDTADRCRRMYARGRGD